MGGSPAQTLAVYAETFSHDVGPTCVEEIERLASEMYRRGLSTRDIEEAIAQATGERLLSRSAVSRLTESLWEDYLAFIQRDLSSFTVVYLFLDAVFESLRRRVAARRAFCVLGRSVRADEKRCCTWPWATRSRTRAGWTSCAMW